jgi:hypothetical protein
MPGSAVYGAIPHAHVIIRAPLTHLYAERWRGLSEPASAQHPPFRELWLLLHEALVVCSIKLRCYLLKTRKELGSLVEEQEEV